MTGDLDPALALAAAGLLLGGLFGAVVQASHFCTMGAVSDLVLFGSLRRLRVWALAIAVALAGTQALAQAGAVPLASSADLDPRLFWLGALLGGFLFGHGMVLAGGCAVRALARLGGGSLKALVVVLLMAVAALAVTGGPLAFASRALARAGSVSLPAPTAGLDAALAAATGLPEGLARAIATLLLLAPLLGFCLKDPRFRRSRADLATGAAMGTVVVLAWLATTALASSPASLTYVAPVGDGLLWLASGDGRVPGFAVATIAGTVLGATLVSLHQGGPRLETFASRDDMVRHCLGGVLMGVGGALALGCSVGQGIAGVSTLSLHALIALPAILAGAWWGVRSLETGRLLPWQRRSPAEEGLQTPG